MRWLRLVYKLWMSLIAVAIVVQIGAAGYGAFHDSNHLKDKGDVFAHKGFEDGWDFHTGLGWLIVYAILIALVLALLARVGRPRIWFQLGLAVAGVLQVVFALAGEDHPWVGIFHPLNAFVILGLAGSITAREWGAIRTTPAQAPAA
jgi:hypothetical protein